MFDIGIGAHVEDRMSTRTGDADKLVQAVGRGVAGPERPETSDSGKGIIGRCDGGSQILLEKASIDAQGLCASQHLGRQISPDKVAVSQMRKRLAKQPGAATGIKDRARATIQMSGCKCGTYPGNPVTIGDVLGIVSGRPVLIGVAGRQDVVRAIDVLKPLGLICHIAPKSCDLAPIVRS